MPVDRAAYRRWDGRARVAPAASLVIAATMIRRIYRLRFVRWILSLVVFSACVVATVVFAAIHEGEGNPAVQQVVARMGFNQVDLLAYATRVFWQRVGFWAVLVAALAGTGLIAEDRRAKALPLYFARPIRRLDYVLGKLLTVSFFLGLLLVAPPACMYVINVALSHREGVALGQLPTLGRALVPSVVGVAVLGSLALGASALCRRHAHAAFLFLGVVAFASRFGPVLAGEILHDPGWQAVSPIHCLHRIAAALLAVPDQIAPEHPFVRAMPLRLAWAGAGAWTAVGLAALVARVRRVEVVG